MFGVKKKKKKKKKLTIFNRNYAINTLKMDAEEWEEIATNGVNTHVLLCHLQCLYTKLEETTQQSPLNDVLEKYKVLFIDIKNSFLIISYFFFFQLLIYFLNFFLFFCNRIPSLKNKPLTSLNFLNLLLVLLFSFLFLFFVIS